MTTREMTTVGTALTVIAAVPVAVAPLLLAGGVGGGRKSAASLRGRRGCCAVCRRSCGRGTALYPCFLASDCFDFD